MRPLKRKEKSVASRLFVADATANSCPEAAFRVPRASSKGFIVRHRRGSSAPFLASRITRDEDNDQTEDEGARENIDELSKVN